MEMQMTDTAFTTEHDKIESLRALLTLSREIAMMLDVVDGDCRDDILDGIGVAEIGLLRAQVEEAPSP